jgi:Golgi nucleoside diphosphatase
VIADVSTPSSSSSSSSSSSHTARYIILIDGGSTGSRAHVHRYYPSQTPNSLPVVEISENKKIKPGLSSYAPDPSKAKESIKELIEFVKTVVPKELWTSTPIHLHVRQREMTTLHSTQVISCNYTSRA